MSCHNIGHGLNVVATAAQNLYEDGALDKNAFETLVRAISRAVYYCDGNEYEALECMVDYNTIDNHDGNIRCGCCLELFPWTETYYPFSMYWPSEKTNKLTRNFAHGGPICKGCFDKYILPYLTEEEKKHIHCLGDGE